MLKLLFILKLEHNNSRRADVLNIK